MPGGLMLGFASLNYYASASNRGETTITLQDKTKSNTTKQACILNKTTHITQNQETKKPGLVASYNI